MAYINDLHYCCGAVELGSLGDPQTPDKILLQVAPSILGEYGLVFFTDTVEYAEAGCTCDDPDCEDDHDEGDRSGPGNAVRLESFIKENKLGTVTVTPATPNPNSGNTIAGWIWAVDQKALEKWFEDNKPKPRKSKVVSFDEALQRARRRRRVLIGA